MTQFNFYKIKPEDLEKLLEISKKTFRDAFYHLNNPDSFNEYAQKAFTKEKLLSEIIHPCSEFYFLKIGENIAGYCKLNTHEVQTDIYDPESLEIERIYVLKEFQNQKLGSIMLDFIKNYSHHHGFNYLWLGVWDKNTDAIRFYTKSGFKEFGSHKFLLGSEIQTDILMRFDLPYVSEMFSGCKTT